jgi:hypothetical protein
LEDGLQVLSCAFDRWCVQPSLRNAGQQQQQQRSAALVLPLLQKCQQQLQQELLPAVQAVLEPAQMNVEGVGTTPSSSSSSSTHASARGAEIAACSAGSPAHLEQHYLPDTTVVTAGSYSISSSQQLMACISPLKYWHFNISDADGSDAAELQRQQGQEEQRLRELLQTTKERLLHQQLQQQRQEQQGPVPTASHAAQQQQEHEVVQGLQQLLSSGKLQAWVAAASSALPLRWCCNNPSCSNLGTAGSKARGSELRRVGGRQCSLCKCACYCSEVRGLLASPNHCCGWLLHCRSW